MKSPPGEPRTKTVGHREIPDDRAAAREEMLEPLREACRLVAFSGGPIVVAVSGGADSVGLLHAMVHGDVLPSVAPGRRRPIIVAHAEHDLREDAPLDREFTAAVARDMGLEFVSRRIACRDVARETGEGIEAAARRLRYAFLVEAAGAAGARAVVVAHSADDQAETILHAILRGTGLAGLAGMPVVRELAEGIALARPMLGILRSVVRGYLAACGQAWRDDLTNADETFARNFLRHAILPSLVEGPYPAAVASIRRLGRQAAGIAGAVAAAADLLLDDHSRREADGSIVIDPRRLARLDRHLLGELFVQLWKREGWPRRDMTARHYLRLADLIGGQGTARPIDLPDGIRCRTSPEGRVIVGPVQVVVAPVQSPRISTRR
jgi:tRNA(Ile)-lysidine synthase